MILRRAEAIDRIEAELAAICERVIAADLVLLDSFDIGEDDLQRLLRWRRETLDHWRLDVLTVIAAEVLEATWSRCATIQ